ncbi:hypothetical protein [Halomonas cerina]|uniref:Acyl CoA:acetate/3-ketoacid CoA transferase n=1 Tax=Halomonas cerina TaxID=447424 RepID=A0A839VHP9_9GAMM|nr:hypothetical protein [Halomonas cerina]MBB3191926.1 acyl CoA:acetate/3-ketoacid CoA transferase [Halomonas cerina]
MNKVLDVEAAVGLIPDDATVAWTTAGLAGFAEDVAAALEALFLKTGTPRHLTVAHSCGCGDVSARA